MHKPVIIVGAGPAGLGVANNLDMDFLILEKESRPGGLMRSKHVAGYTFDWAGHIFFTKIPRILRWVESLMEGNFHWQNRESWVFSKNTYTLYPFQANTYGLPPEVIKECLMGLIQVTCSENPPPANFEEWIYATYGDGIARHFMIPYNRKLWARDLKEMDFHWLSGRVPRPGLSEFIDGALQPGRKDMGPNARFGYPLRGGMEMLVRKLAEPLAGQLRTETEVRKILPASREVITASGERLSYDNLVLTIPVTEAVGMTENPPVEIRAAARELEYLSVLCVNVGVARPDITEKHWIYFPEPAFLFHRVFVQGNASPYVCPEGCFSYTAEITYNATKKVDFDAAGRRTIEGLTAAGLLRESDEVQVVDLIDIPYGYIVPTHQREQRILKIKQWFRRYDIHLVGRFAEWAYYNMDHSLDAGWRLAETLNR